MSIKNKLMVSALAGMIAFTAGCAFNKKQEIQLQDPQKVPKEKWSDAMHVLDAMWIIGQRDIPREYITKVSSTAGYSATQVNAADVGLAGANVAASGSASGSGLALGLSAGLFLLGGGCDPSRAYQIAAFVPESLAGSPQEAVALVEQKLEEARARVYPEKRAKLKNLTGKYPVCSRRSYGGELSGILTGKLVPFDTPAVQSPGFLKSEKSYGPIFIHQEQFSRDALKNDLEVYQGMHAMSKELPDWFYLYYPGYWELKNPVAARIINKGDAMFFIGK